MSTLPHSIHLLTVDKVFVLADGVVVSAVGFGSQEMACVIMSAVMHASSLFNGEVVRSVDPMNLVSYLVVSPSSMLLYFIQFLSMDIVFMFSNVVVVYAI